MHLSYVRERTGHALIGARQWIPAEHLDGPVTSLVMGLPEDLVFRTKGQLAIDICTEALADSARFDFLCGDEVYGACTELRGFCEERRQGYVLRVRSTFALTLARGVTMTCAQAVTRLLKDTRRWEVRSAGTGSKGQRWYAWAWLATASPRPSLLIRRHLATGELAFHYCYTPEGQPVSKAKNASSLAKTTSAWTSPKSASTPRSPATPSWSWPPWPSAPSPPPCCATGQARSAASG